MELLFYPAAVGDFSLLQALAEGLIPADWETALWNSLDGAARLSVYQTSTACADWARQNSYTLATTVTGYSGLSTTAWQRQLARAEHTLALRGPRRGNRVVVRLPSPNPSALGSVLSIAPAAGVAVSELAVQQHQSSQSPYEGVYTPWLQDLPNTCPNITTLRIDRLCGCLPPAAMLPRLKELHVTIVADSAAHPQPPTPAPETAAHILASIAAYLPQLTTLHVGFTSTPAGQPQWSALFSRQSSSLQRFSTSADADSTLVTLLCQHARSLHHLGCASFTAGTDTQQLAWQVKEITLGEQGSVRLDGLPSTTAGHVSIHEDLRDKVWCYLHLDTTEGLSETLQQRSKQWRITEPVTLSIYLPDTPMTPEQDLKCVDTVAQHLYSLLRIEGSFMPVYRGMTLQRATSEVNVRLMEKRMVEEYVARRDASARQHTLPAETLYAGNSWLVRYVAKLQSARGDKIVAHDGAVMDFSNAYLEASRCLDIQLAQFKFALHGRIHILISIHERGDGAKWPHAHQAEVVRKAVQLLFYMRMEAVEGASKCELVLCLDRVVLCEQTLSMLRLDLLNLALPCTLEFSRCEWLPERTCFKHLPVMDPGCFDAWVLSGAPGQSFTAQHVIDICAGAQARGDECRPLQLVCYVQGSDECASDEARTRVESFIHEQGLRRWVAPIEWRFGAKGVRKDRSFIDRHGH